MVTLENKTDGLLVLNASGLSHGVWETAPPSFIDSASTGSWENDSDGFMTGDQGMAAYALVAGPGKPVNKGQVSVNWDNPYAGTNSYSVSCPPGYDIKYTGGDGGNASVKVTLTISSSSKEAARAVWTEKQ
ncbi:MAG: Crystal protein ET79 [Pseudolabrys sp.]